MSVCAVLEHNQGMENIRQMSVSVSYFNRHLRYSLYSMYLYSKHTVNICLHMVNIVNIIR